MLKQVTLFQANDGNAGYELWITDGTATGTTLLKDTYPGPGNGSPYDFAPLGFGHAIFHAYDGSNGTEPWVTDGTAAGTSLTCSPSPTSTPATLMPSPATAPST